MTDDRTRTEEAAGLLRHKGGVLAEALVLQSAGTFGGKDFSDEVLRSAATAAIRAVTDVLWAEAYGRAAVPEEGERRWTITPNTRGGYDVEGPFIYGWDSIEVVEVAPVAVPAPREFTPEDWRDIAEAALDFDGRVPPETDLAARLRSRAALSSARERGDDDG